MRFVEFGDGFEVFRATTGQVLFGEDVFQNDSDAKLLSLLGQTQPIVGLLAGCDRSSKANASASAPVSNVQVVHLKTGEITRRITLPGNLRAYQEAMLYAKVPGYLKSIAVDRGDWVKANDVLAEIEAPEMLADVTKFKAELDVAEIEVEI